MTSNIAQQCTQRIAYVVKRFPRFSETFILNELLELQRQGMDVEVFSLMKPADEPRHEALKDLRFPVTYLPRTNALKNWNCVSGLDVSDQLELNITHSFGEESSTFADLIPGKDATTAAHLVVQASALAMLTSARKITHLHAHFCSNPTTVAMLAARLCGISYSFTAHARDIYHCYVDEITDTAVRNQKIRESAFMVTVSDYNRRHLQQQLGPEFSTKIRRLYNGIDLSVFSPVQNTGKSRHFVGVGRLVEKKGFTYLLEACRLLQQQGNDFRCSLIGEGPELENLHRQIFQYSLQDKVVLAGRKTQQQLITILKTATAVVLPCIISESGDRDGLPTVLLEAMAMGLPVVSTHVAGVPEIIDHGETGWLVEPKNSVELAWYLTRMLDYPEECERMGMAGRHKAEHQFDLTKSVSQLAHWITTTVEQTLDEEETDDAYRLRCG